MWKPEHRRAADRRGLRCDGDLTDAEWALVAPLIRPAKRGGRARTVDVREVLDAIFFSIRPVGVKALVGAWAVWVRLSLQALTSLRNRPGGPSMMGSEGQGGTIYVSSFPLKS